MTSAGDNVSVVMGSDGKYYCKSSGTVAVGDNVQVFIGSDGKYYASKSGNPSIGSNVLVSMDSTGKYIAHVSGISTPVSATLLYITMYDIHTTLRLKGSDLSTEASSDTGVNHIDAPVCVDPSYIFYMTLVNGSDYYLYRCPRAGGTCISHNINDFMNSLSCNGGTIFFGTNLGTGLLYLYNVGNCYLRGTFDTGFSSLDAVTCDSDNVYYTTWDTAKVYKRDIDDIDNNTGSVLATTAAGVTYDTAALCTDRTYVYLATVTKITKYNCSDLSFVSDITLSGRTISRITTDGEFLYYIDPKNSEVVKANCSDLSVVDSASIASGDPTYIASYPPWII